MKSRTLTLITAMTFFAALVAPLHLAAQKQTRYTVTDLGTLGGTFSVAFAINNKGQIAGTATLPNDTAARAFLWRRGVMKDLGTLGGPNSTGMFPLNESGEVPGASETGAQDPLAEDFCGFGTSLKCVP